MIFSCNCFLSSNFITNLQFQYTNIEKKKLLLKLLFITILLIITYDFFILLIHSYSPYIIFQIIINY